MTVFVTLLRAVNVGGTGKLPMSELVAICQRAGFARVRTYIASGNCVFASDATPATVKAVLEASLAAYVGKPVGVVVRTEAEIQAVLVDNPFPESAPERTVAILLDTPPPRDALEWVAGHRNEAMALGRREIYVHYPDGIGDSKLKIPAAKGGTARNMNTIARLARMASAL
jgi:uncharacterized protein (DUF1697 family)